MAFKVVSFVLCFIAVMATISLAAPEPAAWGGYGGGFGGFNGAFSRFGGGFGRGFGGFNRFGGFSRGGFGHGFGGGFHG